MKNELETLKEMRAELDAKIDKLIKPEFEVGKWYKDIDRDSQKTIACIISQDGDKVNFYGFDFLGNWIDKDWFNYTYGITHIVPATPTEVQEALEKEAIKRGFKEGVRIKDLQTGTIKKVSDHKFEFYIDMFCDGYGCAILENGTWAEIQKTMTIEELASEFDKKYRGSVFNLEAFFRQYLTENKTQIIETINSI